MRRSSFGKSLNVDSGFAPNSKPAGSFYCSALCRLEDRIRKLCAPGQLLPTTVVSKCNSPKLVRCSPRAVVGQNTARLRNQRLARCPQTAILSFTEGGVRPVGECAPTIFPWPESITFDMTLTELLRVTESMGQVEPIRHRTRKKVFLCAGRSRNGSRSCARGLSTSVDESETVKAFAFNRSQQFSNMWAATLSTRPTCGLQKSIGFNTCLNLVRDQGVGGRWIPRCIFVGRNNAERRRSHQKAYRQRPGRHDRNRCIDWGGNRKSQICVIRGGAKRRTGEWDTGHQDQQHQG